MNSREEQKHSFILSDEMKDIFKQVAEEQHKTIRLCKTILAGFKASNEKDIKYMDSYMDPLWDMMEQGNDVEQLYREYLEYIATFNPEESRNRIEDLDYSLGYWTPVIYAAAYVARELHRGHKDSDGSDYFKSCLLHVGSTGATWKEHVAGFLYDTPAYTGMKTEILLDRVKNQLIVFSNNKESLFSLVDEFDISPFPGNSVLFPSDNDWKEIADVLYILDPQTAANHKDYIQRLCRSIIALSVKFKTMDKDADMDNNDKRVILQMLNEYYN
ncbi:MAG: hypothetical protein IK103_04045 [Bacteroidales bacterium]|nr:hypothetical protein [Bacteroidales bacterium]